MLCWLDRLQAATSCHSYRRLVLRRRQIIVVNTQLNLIRLASTLFISAICMSVQGQPDLQRSHVEANVPSPETFERLLVRDLTLYFGRSTGQPISSIKVTSLREGPTQSGVAYPKYYFWVRVICGSTLCTEGAVRVAAIQREKFEVTDFLSKDAIIASPANASHLFPAALIARIHELAGLTQR